MQHLGATLIAAAVFFISAFLSGLLPVSLADVSPETQSVEQRHETWSMKPGVSRDGALLIEHAPAAPRIPPWAKSLNRSRTLRAFVAPDRSGIPSLYVEQVRPHAFYVLGGVFMLDSASPALAWLDDRTLVFYATSPSGQPTRYTADIGAIALSGVSADFPPSVQPPVYNILP